MRVFPQLGSGSAAQFPFSRQVRYRSIRNAPIGGPEIGYQDPYFEERRWRLSLSSLSDAEWTSIESLFVECGGRLLPFLFLEPGANLLRWSERLSDPSWSTSGTIAVHDDQADPNGESHASRIVAGSSAAIAQTLEAPADFAYAASCSFRTSHAGVTLSLQDGVGLTKTVVAAPDGTWHRYDLSFRGSAGSESLEWKINFPANSEVDVYGPQLEAQQASSVYKQTASRSGVFSAARFDHDLLPDRLTGPGSHSGEVTIVWTPLLS